MFIKMINDDGIEGGWVGGGWLAAELLNHSHSE